LGHAAASAFVRLRNQDSLVVMGYGWHIQCKHSRISWLQIQFWLHLFEKVCHIAGKP
jgi:hypothetical protein